MRYTFWDTGWPGASAGKLGLRYAPWDVGWIAMSAVLFFLYDALSLTVTGLYNRYGPACNAKPD